MGKFEKLQHYFQSSPFLAEENSAPLTLQEALRSQDLGIIENFLKTNFDLVARDNYAWLCELHDAGYSYHDPLKDLNISASSILKKNEEAKRVVQDLCGLGGISPVSSDRKDWNGNVTFSHENTHANVSYIQHPREEGDFKLIISRIMKALEGFLEAFGFIQNTGLCCDSFTVLFDLAEISLKSILNPKSSLSTPPQIELCKVGLSLVLILREELTRISFLSNLKKRGHKIPSSYCATDS